jgi:hypothetical protein
LPVSVIAFAVGESPIKASAARATPTPYDFLAVFMFCFLFAALTDSCSPVVGSPLC